MLRLEEHLNYIRKIAWRYTKSYDHLDFDDVFGESCLSCVEASEKYDPTKTLPTTYIHTITNNHIRSMLRKQIKEAERQAFMTAEEIEEISTTMSPEDELLSKEHWAMLWDRLSDDAKEVCTLLFYGQFPIDTDKPKLCRGELARQLEEKGWKHHKIWKTFKEIRNIVDESD